MKRVVDDVNKTVEFYAYSYEHVKIQSTLLNFPWSQLETSHGWRLYEHVNKKRFLPRRTESIWSILKIEIQIKLNARMIPDQKFRFIHTTNFSLRHR